MSDTIDKSFLKQKEDEELAKIMAPVPTAGATPPAPKPPKPIPASQVNGFWSDYLSNTGADITDTLTKGL